MYDVVYILKNPTETDDLKYSIRSICKYIPFKEMHFVGYRPTWATGVNYISTIQTQNKGRNSTLNVVTACRCSDISDNFILMNDDFFCLRPIENVFESLNKTQDEDLFTIGKRYKQKKEFSRWKNGFLITANFLRNLGYPTLSYELHIPMIVNKENFLRMYTMPPVNDLFHKYFCVFKRSLYKNIFPDENPIPMGDVKINRGRDNIEDFTRNEWFSIFNQHLYKNRFPRINDFLEKNYSEKCKYEKD